MRILIALLATIAGGQAIEGTTFEQYLQLLRRFLHSRAIRHPRCRIPVSYRSV